MTIGHLWVGKGQAMNSKEQEQTKIPDNTAAFEQFSQCLAAQRRAYHVDPVPTLQQRIADLDALKALIRDHEAELVEAVNADYGSRCRFETRFSEILMVLEDINRSKKQLKKWMKPQKRHIDRLLFPTSSCVVVPQPLGVVGVIVPWNFPIMLALAPIVSIFAAGNRAMVKMSENSEHLAQLLIKLVPQYFAAEKLQVFADNGGSGPAFSAQPFDHLFFTGSAQTGRAVMASAAKNLTPVTLELGGKSPAVVAPDFALDKAVDRIIWAKAFNAGQICTNVDYVFIPQGAEQQFAELAQQLVAQRYPDINHNDYTAIIDERAYQRLQTTLDDAISKGARAVNLMAGQQSVPGLRKFPLTLLFDVTDDMLVMQREIFGPLLPVKTYSNAQDVVQYINSHPRPLAFYPFSHDKSLQQFYLEQVMSGGVTINHAILHVGQHDLPFGGIGDSGMGHYHGFEGFLTFSKLRPIFKQGAYNSVSMLMPPYGWLANKMTDWLIKFKG
ncbi:coniferyl aldehyde dehydrogenase [Rheinheimera baltica]|uniref:coniferyl aldehyde dehydrogenase n=1 Tax=Rheinheimera baltica TaxID=67576 RepID=UPI00273D1637|nr:coniferyl aldehyde dehydrogenase [Rheinheimera baltica]MDP5190109.1 coniferyl aldehyde dehydrogenase [Rheinheimera baltica]